MDFTRFYTKLMGLIGRLQDRDHPVADGDSCGGYFTTANCKNTNANFPLNCRLKMQREFK